MQVLVSELLFVSYQAAAQQETQYPNPDGASTAIEQLVRPHVDAELLSGVILVARGDQIEYQQSFGYSSWERRTPISGSSRFGIGSITKALTVTLVDVLVRAGRLELDAPVERYIPGFPKGPGGTAPTINHLLMHRGGVPHRVTTPIDETQALYASDIVARVRRTGLLLEPGTQRLYSSAGYTSLARVIEVIEDKPFAAILEEHVFNPAGMTSTIDETGQRLMTGRALPHRLGAEGGEVVVKSAPYKDLRFLTGAGSVYATAEDLLSFVRAIRNGVFGNKAWGSVFGNDDSSWQSYTGRTNGYESSIDVLASENLVFVFLSNLQSASNWQVRAQIQALLQNDEVVSIPLPPPVGEMMEDPRSLVGTYGRAEISFVDDTLFRGDNEFYPIDGGSYYIPASGTKMKFRRNADGNVDALISTSAGGRESVMERSVAAGN